MTKLKVNEATAEELDAVDGLRDHGFEIVRYRGDRRRFDSLRQLGEMPGMAGKADGALGALLTVRAIAATVRNRRRITMTLR